MKTFKKSELKKYRVHTKRRSECLADAFLRGVPYRVLERKTHWDDDPHWAPGELNYTLLSYDLLRQVFPFYYERQFVYADYHSDECKALLAHIKEWFLKPLDKEGEGT